MFYTYTEYKCEYVCDLFGWWVYRLVNNDEGDAYGLRQPTGDYTEGFEIILFENFEDLYKYAYDNKKDVDENE